MAGNKAGALKARDANLRRYGADYYKRIGQKGGQTSKLGGFHANRELARIAGRKGGLVTKKDYHKHAKGTVASQQAVQPRKIDVEYVGTDD